MKKKLCLFYSPVPSQMLITRLFYLDFSSEYLYV